jgi:aminopeptidase N
MSGVRHVAAVAIALVVVLVAGTVASASTEAMTLRVELPVAATPPPPPDPIVTPAASAIVPGSVHRTSLNVRATYDVHVRLGVAARTVSGRVEITAQNRSGAGIDRLELNTVMPRLGGMRLGPTTVDGVAVKPSVDDQTILVPLGGVLPDGATAVVRVRFAATLRTSLSGSSWLFARANGISNLYRWIPWVSRRTPFDRPNHGDPFVTPVSPSVTVTYVTDVPVVIASTGQRMATSADRLTQEFHAVNVRDITTAVSTYRTLSATVGSTVVRVYYRPGAPATALLTAAKAALAKLEARLGPYPYTVLKIVQSAGGYGMEGPGVAWIPTGVGSSNLSYLVTHEVAHQWFYGIVGNDQAREPFADEAMADFVARYVLGMRRASRCATAPLDRSIYRYGATCYYEQIYIQGGNLIDAARRKMGSTAFWRAVRGYLSDHRWGLSHTRTLLRALDDATSLNLGSWWGSRFPTLY